VDGENPAGLDLSKPDDRSHLKLPPRANPGSELSRVLGLRKQI
jgi:hypothetical protein